MRSGLYSFVLVTAALLGGICSSHRATAAGVIDASAESFETAVLASKLPVAVFFTSSWCRPCQMMESDLKEVAKELDGQVIIVRVDGDQAPEIESRYNVTQIPTLVLFEGGKPTLKNVGTLPGSYLLRWIRDNL